MIKENNFLIIRATPSQIFDELAENLGNRGDYGGVEDESCFKPQKKDDRQKTKKENVQGGEE